MASMPVAINNLRDIDNYYLSIDRGSHVSGDTQVSFTDEANLGGDNIFASQNYQFDTIIPQFATCLLYTSPSPRDRQKSRMPSSA